MFNDLLDIAQRVKGLGGEIREAQKTCGPGAWSALDDAKDACDAIALVCKMRAVLIDEQIETDLDRALTTFILDSAKKQYAAARSLLVLVSKIN